MNYHSFKFHALFKKLTIDVSFRWLQRISCVEADPHPIFVSRTLFPHVSRSNLYRLCLMYIHISDKGGLLIQGGGNVL